MTRVLNGDERVARVHAPMYGRPLGNVGDRVCAVHFKVDPGGRINDNETVPPGTLGTINHISYDGARGMRWDNGSTISLLLNEDEWEVMAMNWRHEHDDSPCDDPGSQSDGERTCQHGFWVYETHEENR